MPRIADSIRQKINEALAPSRLAIIDESHQHAGHAGARHHEGKAGDHPEGETHFRVEIVSTAFAGESRVARQRRVYELLAEELKGPVHALSLQTLTPEEEAA